MTRPLGLPVGSVRALCLAGLTARGILDLQAHRGVAAWLAASLLVCAAAYFASRASRDHAAPAADGTGARPRHPLGLPVGTVRVLFLCAVAYGGWLWFRDHPGLGETEQPLVIVVGAFLIGVLVRWFLAQVRRPDDASTLAFEHLQAFVAIVAVAGLVGIAATHRTDEVAAWVQPTLAAAATYYAGVR